MASYPEPDHSLWRRATAKTPLSLPCQAHPLTVLSAEQAVILLHPVAPLTEVAVQQAGPVFPCYITGMSVRVCVFILGLTRHGQ